MPLEKVTERVVIGVPPGIQLKSVAVPATRTLPLLSSRTSRKRSLPALPAYVARFCALIICGAQTKVQNRKAAFARLRTEKRRKRVEIFAILFYRLRGVLNTK